MSDLHHYRERPLWAWADVYVFRVGWNSTISSCYELRDSVNYFWYTRCSSIWTWRKNTVSNLKSLNIISTGELLKNSASVQSWMGKSTIEPKMFLVPSCANILNILTWGLMETDSFCSQPQGLFEKRQFWALPSWLHFTAMEGATCLGWKLETDETKTLCLAGYQ